MLYERIRELREDKDMPQKEIAELLNLNRRTYSSYETGEKNDIARNTDQTCSYPCGERRLPVGADGYPKAVSQKLKRHDT